MKDNLYTGKEAQERIANGIHKCAEAVGSTMGTAGHNALIEAIESPGHLATNDGATILNAIHLEDPLEEMGRKVVVEAVSRANKASGDGSSTTTVLIDSLVGQGIQADISPMKLKTEIENLFPLIEASLLLQTRPIVKDGVIDFDLLRQVATISAEDGYIGQMITDIYKNIGVGGIIHWDISKTFEDYYTIGKGITVDGAGLTSPYFADMNLETGQFSNALRLEKPYILITKQKLTTIADNGALFERLHRSDTPLVIFCDEFDPQVIVQLVQTKIKRGFKASLVKMPTLWKDWWYQDLAKATGATIVDGVALSMKDVKEEHLGGVDNIIVDKDNTYLDGIKDMSEHLEGLSEIGDDDSKLRASRLNTQTARYYVGAKSDSALSYRRLKVEDALNSAYHAIENGIVAGGGVALSQCTTMLPQTLAGTIVSNALFAPMLTIAKNAGTESYDGDQKDTGLDTRTGQFVNMFEAGIVDSADANKLYQLFTEYKPTTNK